ncbi:hypothetical protein BDK51DRAFT_48896 [Blyttiomyces helicus]|uniref:Uncharacterized protein n=1 Tax=Blyttiomyces helicus TaxID=388810 RepID=A0A4V1IPX3_9FUNG|nr:hypothetical protein BDK51DRAFT_48896 [Blyttiomyces helicus]|eukprot:RKO84557.1 hypothetical protein BDK51DRAFT_48896 [Blyttiomyces helicus]
MTRERVQVRQFGENALEEPTAAYSWRRRSYGPCLLPSAEQRVAHAAPVRWGRTGDVPDNLVSEYGAGWGGSGDAHDSTRMRAKMTDVVGGRRGVSPSFTDLNTPFSSPPVPHSIDSPPWRRSHSSLQTPLFNNAHFLGTRFRTHPLLRDAGVPGPSSAAEVSLVEGGGARAPMGLIEFGSIPHPPVLSIMLVLVALPDDGHRSSGATRITRKEGRRRSRFWSLSRRTSGVSNI